MRSAPPLSSSAVPMIEAIAISRPICPHVRPNPSPTRSPAGVRARAAASCAERPRARAACSTTPAGVSKVTSRAAPSSARNAWMRRNRIPPTTSASASRNSSRTSTGRHAQAVRPGCQGQSMHNAQCTRRKRMRHKVHKAQGALRDAQCTLAGDGRRRRQAGGGRRDAQCALVAGRRTAGDGGAAARSTTRSGNVEPELQFRRTENRGVVVVPAVDRASGSARLQSGRRWLRRRRCGNERAGG